MDGTLVDNYSAIHSCIVEAFETLRLPIPTYQKTVKSVGGSIIRTIERLIGKEHSREAAELYVKLFPKHIFNGLKVLSFTPEVLSALHSRGLRVACLTNKGQEASCAILNHLNMSQFFDCIQGTSLDSKRKPDIEFTQELLGKLSLNATDCIMIGDSRYDLETALNSGMQVALVATGADNQNELLGKCPELDKVYPDMKSLAQDIWGEDFFADKIL